MINDPIIRALKAVGTPKESRILLRHVHGLKTTKALSMLFANVANARAKIVLGHIGVQDLSVAIANKQNIVNSKLLGRALSDEEGRMIFFKTGFEEGADYLAMASVEYVCACRLFKQHPYDPTLIRETGNNLLAAINKLQTPADALKILGYAKRTFPDYLKTKIDAAIDDFNEQVTPFRTIPIRTRTTAHPTSPVL